MKAFALHLQYANTIHSSGCTQLSDKKVTALLHENLEAGLALSALLNCHGKHGSKCFNKFELQIKYASQFSGNRPVFCVLSQKEYVYGVQI